MKVAIFVWDVCKDIVLGKYTLEDIDLIISPTVAQNEKEAKRICETFAMSSWAEIMTEDEQKELNSAKDTFEKYWEFVNKNCKKAQEVFWEIWNSGKMLQPRLMFGECIVSFDIGKVYDSVEDYIEYLEKHVCPCLINSSIEEHQKQFINYLRSL